MDAVILAAGEGSRLEREENHLPKIFIEVDNQPLYQWQISVLDNYCDRIIFMLGHGFGDHHNPEIKFNISNNINAEVEFQFIQDWNDYENAYTAKEGLELVDDHVLLVCGDVIFNEEPVRRITSKFEEESKPEGENIVGAVRGIQEEMTAVQVDSDEHVSAYGAIEGHQEIGIFLLHRENIPQSVSTLSDNANDWFPVIFDETPSKVSWVNKENRHEINNQRHLKKAREKFNI